MLVATSRALARQSRHDRRIGRAETVIPHGDYCYRIAGVENGPDRSPALKTQRRPYWKGRKDRPQQRFGYCRLLKVGDYTQGRNPEGEPRATLLFWDQVKECGINPDPLSISSLSPTESSTHAS
jgi:hypothetical protein